MFYDSKATDQTLSLRGGCTGTCESTLAKIPCWKSCVMAHLSFLNSFYLAIGGEMHFEVSLSSLVTISHIILSGNNFHYQLKYCRINKKSEKSTLSASFTLFSLELFDMRVEKAAVFFDKIFNLVFLLCFSVIRWNFGIFLVLFDGGVLLLVEWT